MSKEYLQDDPKLLSIIEEGVHGQIVLIGFPYDEGVMRNGGRHGSELGPDCTRRFFPMIGSISNPELNHSLAGFVISDYGNIMIADDNSLESNHEKLKAKVKTFLNKHQQPSLFVIGGGHDLSWPVSQGFLYYCEQHSFTPVVLAVDSQLNVSQLNSAGQIHSGCPFRLLLNTQKLSHLGGCFLGLGVQGSVCGQTQADFVTKAGGEIVWLRSIRNTDKEAGLTQGGTIFQQVLRRFNESHRIYVSFDLSALSSSVCPGVNSPSVTDGLTAEEAIEIAYLAGLDSRVILIDVVEFNPSIEDFRTGRLLASLLYYFSMGKSALRR